MPISILQPPPGAYVGVGMYVYVTVDGPTLFDDRVIVSVTDGTTTFVGGDQLTFGGTVVGVQLGWDSASGQFAAAAQSGAALGAACSIFVALLHAVGTLVESGTFPGYFHDPVTGWLGLLAHLPLSAGLTGPQATELNQILTNTESLVTIEQLLKSTTSPVALANPYSGSGSLSASAGATYALGLRWAVNTAPSEAGQTPRSVLIYSQTYISITVHYKLHDASSIVGETVLSGEAEGLHIFDGPQPASIAYQILPGWTVHLDWLVKP